MLRSLVGSEMCIRDSSGSMGMCLPDDTAHQSKLEVAKHSVSAIVRQLRPNDHLSITLFDHNQQLLLPLQQVSNLDLDRTHRLIRDLQPSGGTKLAEGFKAGAQVLNGPASPGTVKRIIFMTDMESNSHDEGEVLRLIRHEASSHQSYTSVLGIGVDLSMASVQQISSTPGARYISVAIAEEFERRLSAEFAHDSVPIAFGIQVDLLNGAQLESSAGHPELAGVIPGSSSFKLSSEFATPDKEDTGLILLRLRPTVGNRSRHRVRVRWTELDGAKKSTELSVDKLDDGFGCDGVRKAVAVAEWVKVLDEYVMDDSADTPRERAASAQRWIDRFNECKKSFVEQVELAGDLSLEGSNKNFMQTLDQMLETERNELANANQKLNQRAAAPTVLPTDCPADFLCPITQDVMHDPVIAADGHSYERDAIVHWFVHRKSSPKTNKPLDNTRVIPNHTLKATIQSFMKRRDAVSQPMNAQPATAQRKVHRSKRSSVARPAFKKSSTPPLRSSRRIAAMAARTHG
eukprot:TRINITY_DN7895_c0_g1_i6.p1 TRINITY_DN7895_c0_g1~~TRINITY_DN7895_c0_g1_i6.p1  ORF type:complete len:518 (+),score=134.66 TRINITY_DN7895_c0_g1_i6:120-1673(+)